MTKVAAVDIGATSGRVMLAGLTDTGPTLQEVRRFPNQPREQNGRWAWDIGALRDEVRAGTLAARDLGAMSLGIDTWAVDYGVVRDGTIIGPVGAYRDPRHAAGIGIVDARIDWSVLYAATGIQRMPINTIYQIAMDDPQRLTAGSTFLMVPDLLTWIFTGAMATDVTNASSTGMVDPRTRQWSDAVLDALGVDRACFLATDEPGTIRGAFDGLSDLPLIGVATHDTASAFAGAPIEDRDTALILSLGTWALIGAETVDAVPDARAEALNVTHELGVDGTVRLLRNVCGMWLLEECRRHWAAQDGFEPDVPLLLRAAADAPAFAAAFDVDAPGLAAPGQGPHTIERHLVGAWDGSRGAVVRAILESMVARIAVRAHEIAGLLGGRRATLHVVGGASRMDMVMQWLADATGMRVVAGPVEATALGNAAVQWRALGAVSGLAQARAAIATLPEIRVFEPVGNHASWQEFAGRLTA